MERIKPSYGNELRTMEEKRMEKDLKKAALPDEGMEGVNGGGTVPDQFAGLDIPKLFEQPIHAADEALTVLAESYNEYLEEKRKYGWPVRQ